MEGAVPWKAAMKPRLPTGLGKRRQTTADVSHTSHSPYDEKQEFIETKENPQSGL